MYEKNWKIQSAQHSDSCYKQILEIESAQQSDMLKFINFSK
jgi:hypothetical protein